MKINGFASSLPRTVTLDEATDELVIIDQTLLPSELRLLRLSGLNEICDAIKGLKVRGAPAIGVAAALGLYCLAVRFEDVSERGFIYSLEKHAQRLSALRPTAKNLSWALERMLDAARAKSGRGIKALLSAMKAEALKIRDEDIEICGKIGEIGSSLIKDGDAIMTVCNAGALAAVEYGTALAPVYAAMAQGKNLSVYALETRPLLQGARLSAYELSENGVDTTVICDNTAAYVMASGKVSSLFVGCDRVAANGDTANKIGTLMLAVLAKHFGIPFYVCAPFSSVDLETESGEGIEVEQRGEEELRSMWYRKDMVAPKAKVINPAFDLTPAALISAFVTESGIVGADMIKEAAVKSRERRGRNA